MLSAKHRFDAYSTVPTCDFVSLCLVVIDDRRIDVHSNKINCDSIQRLLNQFAMRRTIILWSGNFSFPFFSESFSEFPIKIIAGVFVLWTYKKVSFRIKSYPKLRARSKRLRCLHFWLLFQCAVIKNWLSYETVTGSNVQYWATACTPLALKGAMGTVSVGSEVSQTFPSCGHPSHHIFIFYGPRILSV